MIKFQNAVQSLGFTIVDKIQAHDVNICSKIDNVSMQIGALDGSLVEFIVSHMEHVIFTFTSLSSITDHVLMTLTSIDNLAMSIMDEFTSLNEMIDKVKFTIVDSVDNAVQSLGFTICDKVDNACQSLKFTIVDQAETINTNIDDAVKRTWIHCV